MKNKLSQIAASLAFFLLPGPGLQAAEPHVLHSRVHAAVATLAPTGRLPAGRQLNLIIGLQLHDEAGFNLFLQQVNDPASPNYHHYVTSPEFMAKFGPTEAYFQAVAKFAKDNGLQVTSAFDERGLMEVTASVSDIEKAFHVTLRTYQHPTEGREFYAPDVEATVDAALPILDVSGLDDFVKPHPMLHRKPEGSPSGGSGGSASGGNYRGYDFRTAYAPGVSLTGSGQYVGLVELEGYYASDITTYESQAGLPNVSLVNPLGLSVSHSDTNGVAECSLDIEMAISMAPGLAGVYVFEGSSADQILGSMVTYTSIKQFSCSWGLGEDATAEGYLQRMEAQGQSFFTASGDGDAYNTSTCGAIPWPSDDPNLVTVGGTTLYMNGTASSYSNDVVWNWGYEGANNHWFANCQSGWWGSGGGISSTYGIPIWQTGVATSANQGSTVWRNVPDVACTGNDVWVIFDQGLAGSFGGTSCASPLWAGFAALVNEQAANEGLPSVGFLAPVFYALGQSDNYSSAFHDVTSGNNYWADSTGKYAATTGFDLCTGWGTPNGYGTINALVAYAGPIWVNFAGACPGAGSYSSPYCTLASGVSAVSTGATICLVGAHSTTTAITITKALTLRAFFGDVTIGN